MKEPKELSKRAQRLLLLANQESKRYKCPHVASEHLLLGALAYDSGTIAWSLEQGGLTLPVLAAYVSEVSSSAEEAPHGYGPSMHGVLRRSYEHAEALSDPEIEPEHLVLGLLDETDGGVARALARFGVDVGAIKQRILDSLK